MSFREYDSNTQTHRPLRRTVSISTEHRLEPRLQRHPSAPLDQMSRRPEYQHPTTLRRCKGGRSSLNEDAVFCIGPSIRRGQRYSQQRRSQNERSSATDRGYRVRPSHEKDEGSVWRRLSSQCTYLTQETKTFQKLVIDVESKIATCGESPEAAWRCRIMIRSAQDADAELSKKLNENKRELSKLSETMASTTYPRAVEGRMRTLQACCLKMHRDYARSHASLGNALASHDAKQHAEISRLGAVKWRQTPSGVATSGKDSIHTIREEEEFFDRAFRQAELERMNKSMHQVSSLYADLAELVESRQDDIDALEENLQNARVRADEAAKHVGWSIHRERLCGAVAGGEETDFWGDRGIGLNCNPSFETLSGPQDSRRMQSRQVASEQEDLAAEEEVGCGLPLTMQLVLQIPQDILHFGVALGEGIVSEAKEQNFHKQCMPAEADGSISSSSESYSFYSFSG